MREIVANLAFRNASNQIDGEVLARKIEQGYLAEKRAPKFTVKKTFAPSSIGYGHGTCARYWYQAFTGAMFIDKTDAVGIANMANGSAAHDRIQKAMGHAFPDAEFEKEMVLADPPIRGYIDALVDIDGETVVGEIKTARSESFMFRQSTMKPTANHLYQILIYFKATGAKNGFFMYENKNDQTFLILPVTMNSRNEKLINDCFDWLREVRKNWEDAKGTDNNLPTRPWTRRNANCRGCPLFEQCWPVDSEGNPDKAAEKPGTVTIAPMVVAKV